jgi:hypothetical protein
VPFCTLSFLCYQELRVKQSALKVLILHVTLAVKVKEVRFVSNELDQEVKSFNQAKKIWQH